MTPYKQIKAARQAAITVGTPLTPKGRCHMCNWPTPKVFCSDPCEEDYNAEVKQHANMD